MDGWTDRQTAFQSISSTRSSKKPCFSASLAMPTAKLDGLSLLGRLPRHLSSGLTCCSRKKHHQLQNKSQEAVPADQFKDPCLGRNRKAKKTGARRHAYGSPWCSTSRFWTSQSRTPRQTRRFIQRGFIKLAPSCILVVEIICTKGPREPRTRTSLEPYESVKTPYIQPTSPLKKSLGSPQNPVRRILTMAQVEPGFRAGRGWEVLILLLRRLGDEAGLGLLAIPGQRGNPKGMACTNAQAFGLRATKHAN